MRILHVVHGFFPESAGGTESYVRDVATEQQRRGEEVSVLTGSMAPWERVGLEHLQVEGLSVVRMHRDDLYFDWHAKAWHPGVELLFGDYLARHRPDVLHVHQWIRLTSNLIEIADELDVPVVLTLHDLYTSCPRAFRVRADDVSCMLPLSPASCGSCVPRYGHETDAEIAFGIDLHHANYQHELSLARAVLVPSQATADVVCEKTGFPAGRFRVLPLAYRRRFEDGIPPPAPLPAAGEPFRFAYWGNLTRRKGAHVLLQAFAALCDRGPPRPVELHLFGRVDTQALQREIDALAAGRPVTLHGRFEHADVAALRPHMAVFPMVCFETFGFVLDEAFELGVPAIVTDIGAMPQRAGEAGLRVPPNDASALAAAMRRVLEEPTLRDRLAARIPSLPPLPSEHVAALSAVYAGLADAPPLGDAPPVDPRARAMFLVQQRESALRALHPGRGPE